jgi:F-type H+-transporting ATPase subunit b
MTRLLSFVLAILLPMVALVKTSPSRTRARHSRAKLAFTAVASIRLHHQRSWPTMRDFMVERRDAVRNALEKADRARREAEALKADMQHRLEKLAGELETMLQQARADIAVERDQILAAARRTAEAIQRDAERTAENETRQAREQLRAEVAHHALAIAERIAPQRLTGDDQTRFVQDFVDEVRR